MRWYIVILHQLLQLAGRLPLRWLHGIGAAVGWSIWALHAAPRHRARVSLSLAITLESDQKRQALLRPTLIETGKALLEVAKIWNGDASRALSLVREVRGAELFDQALAARRGLIIAAPHLG